MDTLITKGIKVGVEVFYQSLQSRPQAEQYIFAYRVHIENVGTDTVQLLARHWYIYDSDATKREVNGPGVIGKQPILEPGDVHQYDSWCPLRTPIGKMNGFFYMINRMTGEEFEVVIPEFKLIAPFKFN